MYKKIVTNFFNIFILALLIGDNPSPQSFIINNSLIVYLQLQNFIHAKRYIGF